MPFATLPFLPAAYGSPGSFAFSLAHNSASSSSSSSPAIYVKFPKHRRQIIDIWNGINAKKLLEHNLLFHPKKKTFVFSNDRTLSSSLYICFLLPVCGDAIWASLGIFSAAYFKNSLEMHPKWYIHHIHHMVYTSQVNILHRLRCLRWHPSERWIICIQSDTWRLFCCAFIKTDTLVRCTFLCVVHLRSPGFAHFDFAPQRSNQRATDLHAPTFSLNVFL